MITKLVFTLFINLWLFQCLFGSDSIPAGNVSGHWVLANSPYKIYGNILLPFNSSLEIDSGVVVIFQGHFDFQVRGRITALGTSTQNIIFTANGSWWGIRIAGISPSQDSSYFINCKVEKGNAGGTNEYANGGAFYISYYSKLRIASCIITNNTAHNNGGGIYFNHSSPVISGNIISNNVANNEGGGIYCSYSAPKITDNTISYNGQGIYCKNSAPLIAGNIIKNNGLSSGIDCESCSPSIINNIISYNGMGIYANLSAPFVTGNVIHHNTAPYGAGIRCVFNSSPLITNNTFAYNTATTYGGALYCSQSSSPVVKNNILWGNIATGGGNQLALDQTSHPSFYNCDVQGGSAMFYYFEAPGTFTGTYINNINVDPLFSNPSNYDYSLQSTSQCIDAGTLDTTGLGLPETDLTGGPRICNSHVDIGAYENCTITGNKDFSSDFSSLKIYPDPSSNIITIETSGQQVKCHLSMINLNGKNIFIREITENKTTLDISNLTGGVYFVRIAVEKRVLTGKFIKH